MRDFKYRWLVSGEEKWGVALNEIRSASLRPVAHAFATDLTRTASLAFTPIGVAYYARRDQRFEDYAAFKSTGKVDPQLSFLVEQELPDVIQQELKEERIKEKSVSAIEFIKRRKDYGLTYVESLLKVSEGMRISLEAIMTSVVIESWTAFETLVSDVWIIAVNEGPQEFAQRVSLVVQGKSDSKIPQHHRDQLQYDPRKEYAAAQVEIGNVTFRRLDRIIYWYSITLKNHVSKIFSDHKDIHALSAYRNVLIHNQGIVDKDFIKQIEPVSDLRGTYKIDRKLELDGGLVQRLRNAAIALGIKLIQAVDDVLSPKV